MQEITKGRRPLWCSKHAFYAESGGGGRSGRNWVALAAPSSLAADRKSRGTIVFGITAAQSGHDEDWRPCRGAIVDTVLRSAPPAQTFGKPTSCTRRFATCWARMCNRRVPVDADKTRRLCQDKPMTDEEIRRVEAWSRSDMQNVSTKAQVMPIEGQKSGAMSGSAKSMATRCA